MRMTKNNIKFVKRLEKDGMTYGWHIVMKSNRISDNVVGSHESIMRG